MNALIVDDEKAAVAILTKLVQEHCPGIEICASASNIEDAVQIITSKEIDLVFLDINLGSESGFDLLRKFTKPSFYTIFITGFDEYAIEAFRFSASDYLLKPIDVSELKSAVGKVATEIQKDHVYFKMQSLLDNLELSHGNKKLVLGDNESIHVIQLKEIIYCVADGSYSKFITSTRKEIFVSKNLKEYEKLLRESGFFRSHRSYLINLSWIRKFDRSKGLLELENGDTIPVTANKKEELFKRLNSIN